MKNVSTRQDNIIDRDYFAANRTKSEYTRPPLPGEFIGMEIPAEARVRVFLINQRSLVKVLEMPDGERLATTIERVTMAERSQQAA